MSAFSSFFAKDKTFRPKKKFEPGTIRFNLHKYANQTLNSGVDISDVVKVPKEYEYNDWIAVHVVDFFNRINLLYGCVSEFCTEETCAVMSGGAKFEYHWCDNEAFKKPTRLSAPRYITILMDWVEKQINDEQVFPTRTDIPFAKNFVSVCKKILTRLYRVFVHVYIHHFDRLQNIGAEPHVNTCYKHFMYFVTEFNLVRKEEFEPLLHMSIRLCPDLIDRIYVKSKN